jgi:hypothetical protein
MYPKGKLGFILFSTIFIVLAAAADVMAIVGRPATSFGYTGLARRSVRRAAY